MPSADFRTVTQVAVEESVDAFTVALAEDDTGTGSFLMVQCAVTPATSQDVATGMDTYCVMDESGAVQYGGIKRVELNGRVLSFDFDDEAMEELELDEPQLVLQLDITEGSLRALSAGLRRVLSYGDPAQHPLIIGLDV